MINCCEHLLIVVNTLVGLALIGVLLKVYQLAKSL